MFVPYLNDCQVPKFTSHFFLFYTQFPLKLLSDDDLHDLCLKPVGEAEALKRYSEFFAFHRQLLKSEHARQAKS